jgi:hypothetical protein
MAIVEGRTSPAALGTGVAGREAAPDRIEHADTAAEPPRIVAVASLMVHFI